MTLRVPWQAHARRPGPGGWAERSGLTPGSEPKFRAALKAQGFEAKRLPGPNVSGFVGLRLNRHDYTDNARYGG